MKRTLITPQPCTQLLLCSCNIQLLPIIQDACVQQVYCTPPELLTASCSDAITLCTHTIYTVPSDTDSGQLLTGTHTTMHMAAETWT